MLGYEWLKKVEFHCTPSTAEMKALTNRSVHVGKLKRKCAADGSCWTDLHGRLHELGRWKLFEILGCVF
ncbi:hypothetical protein GQ457_02G016860 [Hibiscus cannabinus]